MSIPKFLFLLLFYFSLCKQFPSKCGTSVAFTHWYSSWQNGRLPRTSNFPFIHSIPLLLTSHRLQLSSSSSSSTSYSFSLLFVFVVSLILHFFSILLLFPFIFLLLSFIPHLLPPRSPSPPSPPCPLPLLPSLEPLLNRVLFSPSYSFSSIFHSNLLLFLLFLPPLPPPLFLPPRPSFFFSSVHTENPDR